ncbi:MAG TPA: RNA polymerase sigma factor, partial [Gemmatimonadaceae bacterium]
MPRSLALHVPALAAGPPAGLPAPRTMSAAEANSPVGATHAVQAALDDFEPFYRAHVRRVYALCLRMCGDRRRAEELTQDVFVRAWERRATFRGASLAATWLHRLAVNVVLAGARADRRRRARVETDAAPEALPGAWADGRAAAAAERLDLERAIATLP